MNLLKYLARSFSVESEETLEKAEPLMDELYSLSRDSKKNQKEIQVISNESIIAFLKVNKSFLGNSGKRSQVLVQNSRILCHLADAQPLKRGSLEEEFSQNYRPLNHTHRPATSNGGPGRTAKRSYFFTIQ